MRTTVTLDDDLYLSLQIHSRQTGKPFRVVLNELVRLGVKAKQLTPRKKTGAIKVKTYPLGLPEGLNYENVGELLEQLEASLYHPSP